MYKKLSEKQKGLFWLSLVFLLALFVYSITLIPLANNLELVIAGLGWAYILLVVLGWFDFLSEIFYIKKKWIVNLFSIVAIIGIVVAVTLNFTLDIVRNPQALPITLIPAIIVLLYFVSALIQVNKK